MQKWFPVLAASTAMLLISNPALAADDAGMGYVGLGAGDVRVGDQFTVFRKKDRVFDPDTGRLIGYHVDVLGWISILEIGEEASLAKIEASHAEIELGDRLMEREDLQALLLEVDLEGVDLAIALDDLVRELRIPLLERRDRVAEGALDLGGEGEGVGLQPVHGALQQDRHGTSWR